MTGPEAPLLALVGPTASGKTEASLPLAQALDAEIVCIDSTVVYRGMDVGTAKPTPAHRARVGHHLLDLVDPGEPFSVARFQRLAGQAIRDIRDRGRTPLLVGGGSLYYRAVADGLRFPGTEPGTRRLLETELAAVGPAGLHGRLAAIDPEAAQRIDRANARRTVRALEVAAVTGRTFSSFARDWGLYRSEAIRVAGVAVPRDVLRRRVEDRVRRIMTDLVNETRRLTTEGFGPFILRARPIGYAEAWACLRGEIGLEQAERGTVRRTMALARRQLAWFRRDPRIRWFPAGEDGARGVVQDVLEYLAGGRSRP